MTNGNVIHTNFFSSLSLKFHNGVRRIFQELTLSDINIDWEKKYTITHPLIIANTILLKMTTNNF